jgi:hypothetical protein
LPFDFVAFVHNSRMVLKNSLQICGLVARHGERDAILKEG